MAVIYFEKVDKSKVKRKMALKRTLFKVVLGVSLLINVVQAAIIVNLLLK